MGESPMSKNDKNNDRGDKHDDGPPADNVTKIPDRTTKSDKRKNSREK